MVVTINDNGNVNCTAQAPTPSNPSQPGDAGMSQAAPHPGPDNGGTLNPRAPSNAR